MNDCNCGNCFRRARYANAYRSLLGCTDEEYDRLTTEDAIKLPCTGFIPKPLERIGLL